MPAVVFYEKPGCLTNARQKALLERHGCRLTVRNLLSEPWTEARLYEFLQQKPVVQWFNPAAPKINHRTLAAAMPGGRPRIANAT